MTGGYWTRDPPKNLGELIGGNAVIPEWNNYQRVYEFTAPAYTDPINKQPKFLAWEGPSAAQPVSMDYKDKEDNGYCLEGGAPQLYVNDHLDWNVIPDTKLEKVTQDVASTVKTW